MRTIEAEAYTVLYCYDTHGDVVWNTSQTFFSETDAIADAMTLATGSVKHIRIVKFNLPRFIIPDTLKNLNHTRGEIIDYGQTSDTQQYADQRDSAKPDAEDSEIFSGT